jgi:hypothetical protein
MLSVQQMWAGLFRIADAFGVQKLILGGTLELNRKVWNTSRATEKASRLRTKGGPWPCIRAVT